MSSDQHTAGQFRPALRPVELAALVKRIAAGFDRPAHNIAQREKTIMTASVTGRKRCGCGQYKTPLANGTMPRHTKPAVGLGGYDTRVRCQYTGKFPPVEVALRKARSERYAAKGDRAEAAVTVPYQIPDKLPKQRGGHRAAKRNANTKARYRRNAAGGYNR